MSETPNRETTGADEPGHAAGVPPRARRGHGSSVAIHAASVGGMFAFAFALVPLYNVICEVTGLNGKTSSTAYSFDAAAADPDRSRLVTVRFTTQNNEGMPWRFRPVTRSVRVHPGELKLVNFYVENPTDRRMVGRAIPSVVPARVAEHFHKTECFCFESQVLEAGESLEMPMRFVLGRELPRGQTSITLSYTMFDITEYGGESVSARSGSRGDDVGSASG